MSLSFVHEIFPLYATEVSNRLIQRQPTASRVLELSRANEYANFKHTLEIVQINKEIREGKMGMGQYDIVVGIFDGADGEHEEERDSGRVPDDRRDPRDQLKRAASFAFNPSFAQRHPIASFDHTDDSNYSTTPVRHGHFYHRYSRRLHTVNYSGRNCRSVSTLRSYMGFI